MQELTKKTVTKLMKDTSRVMVAEDCELIQELDALADKVVNQSPEERRLLNQPFELCGIKFYPLTIAKSLWFAEKCKEWEVEGIFQDAFLFWLLTLPLDEACFDAYALRKDADKAVKRLSRRLHCTQKEMTDVFQLCIGGNGKKSESGESVDYGSLIALMLREYGGTPDQWLYETPVEKVGALVDQYVHRMNAEQDASRSTSAKRGKAVAPPPSAKLIALKAFNTKMNQIKEKWVANG